MTINVNKKLVLTLISGICGVGSVMTDLVSKKNETDEIAEKAAKIVMKQMSKKEI